MSYAPIAMPTGSQDTITLLRANTLLVSLKPSTPVYQNGAQGPGGMGGWEGVVCVNMLAAFDVCVVVWLRGW